MTTPKKSKLHPLPLFSIALLLALAMAPKLSAQGYLNVDNFSNSYEINIYREGNSKMIKCQAVRLHKDWFLTSAHCFTSGICDNSCTIEARLFFGRDKGTLNMRYEADISVLHQKANPNVFLLDPQAEKISASRLAAYDIALVHFPPQNSEYTYKDLGTSYLIKKQDFLDEIAKTSGTIPFYNALKGQTPPKLLLLKTQTQKMLNRIIMVPSIWDGSTHILSSQKNPVFFSPRHKFIYTLNFGIRQGVSGAGVMTNHGELVGIVASTASLSQTGAVNAIDNYSFFAAFDDTVINFIKKTMGRDALDLNVIEGDILQLRVVPKEYYDFTSLVEKMEDGTASVD